MFRQIFAYCLLKFITGNKTQRIVSFCVFSFSGIFLLLISFISNVSILLVALMITNTKKNDLFFFMDTNQTNPSTSKFTATFCCFVILIMGFCFHFHFYWNYKFILKLFDFFLVFFSLLSSLCILHFRIFNFIFLVLFFSWFFFFFVLYLF